MCYLGMFEEGKAGDQEPGGGGLVVFPRERFSSTKDSMDETVHRIPEVGVLTIKSNNHAK